MTCRAVFFDAGETLVHPTPSFPELFASIVTREGHPRDAGQIVEGLSMVSEEFTRAAVEEELWTTHPDRSRRFWLGVYERFLEALDISSSNGLTETLYHEFTRIENYGAFDDVRPTLEQLQAAGLELGVISNFEPWLEDLLAMLELTPLLPTRVISGIEGVEKPDPTIFLLALERSGLRAEEVAYVGDIPEFDIVPTAALGMFPVLIDRRGRHPGHVGARVTDLRDLPGVIGA
jgi:putative hydrolase of the HAD superfamily